MILALLLIQIWHEANFCPLTYFKSAKVLPLPLFANHSIAITHSLKSSLVISFPNTLHLMVEHSFSSPLSTIDPSLKYIHQPHPHVDLGYKLKFLRVHRDAELLKKKSTLTPRWPSKFMFLFSASCVIFIVPSDLSLDYPTVLNQVYLQEESWKPNVI